MLVLVSLLFSIPLILVWFLFIIEQEIFAFLAAVPLVVCLVLAYFWINVNGFFVKIGIDEIKPCSA